MGIFVGMIKRARACVYVGEVSDAAKQRKAERDRTRTHTAKTQKQLFNKTAPSHLYVPKSLWLEAGRQLGVSVQIVDHTDLGLTYPTAAYRYSVYVDIRGHEEIAVAMRQFWREHWQPKFSATSTSVANTARSWLAPHFNQSEAGHYFPNTARPARQSNYSRFFAKSVATFLLAMADAGMPPVICCGSLLRLVRGDDLSDTEDVDFVVFHRHLNMERLNATLKGASLRKLQTSGSPFHEGFEITFQSHLPYAPKDMTITTSLSGETKTVRPKDMNIKIDLFIATEGYDNYGLSLWKNHHLIQCHLPGPTEFVPVIYPGWDSALFFM